MNPVLNKNLFVVKEHVDLLKAANSFDIFDAETQQQILTCREENLGIGTKILRFTKFKRMTPFDISISSMLKERIISVRRGTSFLISTVEVWDEKNALIGKFKQKWFTIGGKFEVLDGRGNLICMLKGNWTSWDFKFISNDNKEFARVTKKWSGLGKEFFTSADNYVLEINSEVPANDPIRKLILGAVMCIDMVLKE